MTHKRLAEMRGRCRLAMYSSGNRVGGARVAHSLAARASMVIGLAVIHAYVKQLRRESRSAASLKGAATAWRG
jgi:hypothetical protein